MWQNARFAWRVIRTLKNPDAMAKLSEQSGELKERLQDRFETFKQNKKKGLGAVLSFYREICSSREKIETWLNDTVK